ncbi:hypothetical protein [Anaerobacillus alkalilacustris]|uniref:hypothetical protein n=1 Tax=Anaerobacillus alkalilacustris TaxID=393763 RepID=UPI0014723817|nr:hypothetical protein [Anaerobacillus alkalilacustris]
MKEFQIEDIGNNKEIINELTMLEKKIETQLGKQVALIAYTEETNQQVEKG